MTPTDPHGAEGREKRVRDWIGVVALVPFLLPTFIVVGAWDGAIKYLRFATKQVTRHPLGGTERE